MLWLWLGRNTYGWRQTYLSCWFCLICLQKPDVWCSASTSSNMQSYSFLLQLVYLLDKPHVTKSSMSKKWRLAVSPSSGTVSENDQKTYSETEVRKKNSAEVNLKINSLNQSRQQWVEVSLMLGINQISCRSVCISYSDQGVLLEERRVHLEGAVISLQHSMHTFICNMS